MTDDGQRTAVRVRQQSRRQCCNERLRRQRGRIPSLREIHQELIRIGCASTEAGEYEGHESVDIGIIRDVGSGKEMLGPYAAEPGPLLTKQSALIRALFWLARSEGHSVRGREQHCGR